jgi:hypothetical protein
MLVFQIVHPVQLVPMMMDVNALKIQIADLTIVQQEPVPQNVQSAIHLVHMLMIIVHVPLIKNALPITVIITFASQHVLKMKHLEITVIFAIVLTQLNALPDYAEDKPVYHLAQ